jgi:hypothetical protein
MQIIFTYNYIEKEEYFMKNFPPDFDPGLFTLSAVAVGAVLVDDFSANEQNSIGNWIIMVGQYILTNAAQQQLIESRIHKNNVNINSRAAKNGQGVFTDGNSKSNYDTQDEIKMLIKALNNMKDELENIKNQNKSS